MDTRPAIRLVRWTGAAVFALALAMLVGMPTTAVRKNLDGVQGAVVGFELVSTPDEVLGILATIQSAPRRWPRWIGRTASTSCS